MRILRIILLTLIVYTGIVFCQNQVQQQKRYVAAIVADWFKYSHPDVLLTRILKTYSLDGGFLSSCFLEISTS